MRPKPFPRRTSWRARLPHPGLALRRHPHLWWLLVATAALSAGALVSSAVATAQRTQRSWGSTRSVLVVERDLPAGHELQPGDISPRRWPQALVPADALETISESATLRVDVGRGEVLVARRVAPDGLRGVAATLGAGTRAVAIPVDPGTTPPLEVGDRVDVMVALAAGDAGRTPPGFVVAAAARVVAVDRDVAVTVAVDRDVAPRVAVALGLGSVTLALVGA